MFTIMLVCSGLAAIALGVGIRLRDRAREKAECAAREREFFASLPKEDKKNWMRYNPLEIDDDWCCQPVRDNIVPIRKDDQ